MVDIVLLVGKFLLLAMVYLFLLAAVRAGIGLVASGGPGATRGLALAVVAGPKELRGTKVSLAGPVVIGRSPGADIVIADDFVSSMHARVSPSGDAAAIIEDLGSTNGTVVNGQEIRGPVEAVAGDEIDLGTVRVKLVKS